MDTQQTACPMCGQDWVARYRVKGAVEVFWLCPECESLWRDGADPRRSTEAYLSIYLEARGLTTGGTELEPVPEPDGSPDRGPTASEQASDHPSASATASDKESSRHARHA